MRRSGAFYEEMRQISFSGAWVVPAAVAADLVTKHIAARLDRPVELAGLVRINAVRNSGIAFSLLRGQGLALILLTGAMLAALAAWLALRPSALPRAARIGLWMIVGGGLGNLLDRIRLGEVIDFIELTFVRFAVFNIADVFVVLGAAVTAYSILRGGTDHAGKDHRGDA
ncbi:MAG: signal peptidase II [Clostridiales bacterium]|nr:signal peptidase II [Clostridiales bacterium]